ncbi:hypothetical protein LguiB_004657 [Lonicera macranthoides]
MLLSHCSCSSINSLISSAPLPNSTSIPFSKNSIFYPFSTSPFKTLFKLCSVSQESASRVFNAPVDVENQEEDVEAINLTKFGVLKQKIEGFGISSEFCTPGQYNHLICPKCKGGRSLERSLSFHINQNESFAMWRCFRFDCGWAGQVFADVGVAQKGVNKSYRQLTEERLRLEPLGDEINAYFAERMISKEILQRNAVMQISAEKNVIAFTYRRNGELVNCKYRSIVNKRFWQEKGAEKILYGLDNIKEADEIIIVEGEIDKLSMEQAGLVNCVSVPDGAPQKVSIKELPPLEKDTGFQYLWNCRSYLDKASRIILATDGDVPGQVLAEELARRLGRERCRLVSWPKKDESSRFKDANEVLQNLGADALRDIVGKAQLYQNQNLI